MKTPNTELTEQSWTKMRAQLILVFLSTNCLNYYSIINGGRLSGTWVSSLSNQRRFFNLKIKYKTPRKVFKMQHKDIKEEMVTDIPKINVENKESTTKESNSLGLLKKSKEKVVNSIEIITTNKSKSIGLPKEEVFNSIEVMNSFDFVKQEKLQQRSPDNGQRNHSVTILTEMKKMLSRIIKYEPVWKTNQRGSRFVPLSVLLTHDLKNG